MRRSPDIVGHLIAHGAGRPRPTHHHKSWWNEMKWMRWVWGNGGMKFVVGENGRNLEKNLPRPRFVHHETHMEWPRRELGTPAVGGEGLTACATRPPISHKIIHRIDRLQLFFLRPHESRSVKYTGRPSTLACGKRETIQDHWGKGSGLVSPLSAYTQGTESLPMYHRVAGKTRVARAAG